MEIKDKNKSVRKLTNKEIMILLIAAGVVIFLLCIPQGSNLPDQKQTLQNTKAESSGTFAYLQDYTDYLEKRLTMVLSGVEGIGEMEVMITLKASEEHVGEKNDITKTIMPVVEGVVISCDGGDSAVIAEEITEAVHALFSIESHKIKILKKI